MGLYDYQPANYNLSGSLVPTASPNLLFGQNWGAATPVADTTTYTPANFSLGQTSTPTFGNMVGTAGSGSSSGNWWDGILSSTNSQGIRTDGWGGLALGTAQGLGNMYLGFQQYGLAKQALQNSKDQFALNYGAQKQLTNSSLEDRQRARVASNPGAYQSVGDYMAKNGIA